MVTPPKKKIKYRQAVPKPRAYLPNGKHYPKLIPAVTFIENRIRHRSCQMQI